MGPPIPPESPTGTQSLHKSPSTSSHLSNDSISPNTSFTDTDMNDTNSSISVSFNSTDPKNTYNRTVIINEISKRGENYIHSRLIGISHYRKVNSDGTHSIKFDSTNDLKKFCHGLSTKLIGPNSRVCPHPQAGLPLTGITNDNAHQEQTNTDPDTSTKQPENNADNTGQWNLVANKKPRKPTENPKPTPSSPNHKSSNPFTVTTENSINPTQQQKFPLKIINSTRNHDPLSLRTLIRSKNLQISQPQNFHGFKSQTTTINFNTSEERALFTSKIESTNFGEKARYVEPALRKQPQTPHKVDYNVVVRGVHPSIETDEFASELSAEGLKFKSILRIFTPTGERTHMMRIFFDDREATSLVLGSGIKFLGRSYRCEPPREQLRHIPCRRCCQYGHIDTNCTNPAKCHRCGGSPDKCTHKPHTNDIKHCSTCDNDDHYTGQVRCPLYPKDTQPTPPQRPNIPLVTPPHKNTQANKIEWPGLIQNPNPSAPWTPLTNNSNTNTNNETDDTPDTQDLANTVNPTTNTLSSLLTEFRLDFDSHLKKLVTKIEKYVQDTVNELEDRLITSLAVVTHNVINTKNPDARTIVNSMSKRLFNKRVVIAPIKDKIDIFVEKFRRELTTPREQTIGSEITHSLSPHPGPSTCKENTNTRHKNTTQTHRREAIK